MDGSSFFRSFLMTFLSCSFVDCHSHLPSLHLHIHPPVFIRLSLCFMALIAFCSQFLIVLRIYIYRERDFFFLVISIPTNYVLEAYSFFLLSFISFCYLSCFDPPSILASIRPSPYFIRVLTFGSPVTDPWFHPSIHIFFCTRMSCALPFLMLFSFYCYLHSLLLLQHVSISLYILHSNSLH
jgi:hypothetical protein